MDIRQDVVDAINKHKQHMTFSAFQAARIEYCQACGQVRFNNEVIQNGLGAACDHLLRPIIPFIRLEFPVLRPECVPNPNNGDAT
jgi:hypothetical protein